MLRLMTSLPAHRRHHALSPTGILFNRLCNLIKSSVNVDDSHLATLHYIEDEYKSVIFSYFELCPKLAEYRDDDGNNILHCICHLYMDQSLSLKLFKYLLEFLSTNLLTCINYDGDSPVDIAVVFSTVQVIKILLGFHPKLSFSALEPAVGASSLLQLFVRGNQMQVLEKLKFLFELDKTVLHNRTVTEDNIPILHACLELTECCHRMPEKFFYIPSYIIDLDLECCSDIRIMHNDPTKKDDNRLPLMTIINRFDFHNDSRRTSWTPLSPYYGLFKKILHAYPKAATVKFRVTKPSQSGVSSRGKTYTTVYEYAMKFNLREEYVRLVLNACREIDDSSMRNYNFNARRLALWTSYRISTKHTDKLFNILMSLRLSSPDAFQKVVCFL